MKDKVQFYINIEGQPEYLRIKSQRGFMLEYLQILIDTLPDAISDFELPLDNWYSAKITLEYESDGSEAMRPAFFSIKKIKCITRISPNFEHLKG